MNYNRFCRFLFSMINDPCYRGEAWVVYFKCINAEGKTEEYYEVLLIGLMIGMRDSLILMYGALIILKV